MRLEHLEIHGFKSFSDRPELAFDHGVTAIVGPNGCGKSNVADAITWVMGEQSAKSLRGDRMEDVIFSGSDARKPGATAEVRLRLTGLPIPPPAGTAEFEEFRPVESESHGKGQSHGNGNGNGNANGNGISRHAVEMFTRDVEVTRRLYRSGESEYLIDGEACRLRDVHELLMDTGLGAKAYAIIEQGKIGMILSSRPADRRQLIEEAAGITKYRARRRAAELKLEAAQQNLTRIDDIVFEVEKQRGALKRQAAKARRYKRLREELRRWEKVLLVRRYRELTQTIDAAQARLADARAREAAASARVAEVESEQARLRLEQAEADARATRVREDAHAHELDINRRQQQQEFDRHHVDMLATRGDEITAELRELESSREPACLALAERGRAADEAGRARDAAASALAEAQAAQAAAQQQIEGLEADVEAARSSVFAALNSATALRHAMEHAAAQRERVSATLGKLGVEQDDLNRETEGVEAEGRTAQESLSRGQATMEQIRIAGAARASELASARTALDAHAKTVREFEQELARSEARLISLVELESSRAEFGDAARMVLVQANGRVGQQGAVADYIEVDRRYERAVEACLGDLVQHVIVERHEHAAAGLALVREHDAGRCGFVVIDAGSTGPDPGETLDMAGVVPVSEVLRVSGPYASTLLKVVPEAYIAETFDIAVALGRRTSAPVATLDGDVVRGPHLVSGGAKVESRSILSTKREIRELRERITTDRVEVARLAEETNRLEVAIAQATSALAALANEQHRQEMALVAFEAQAGHAREEAERLNRKAGVIALERRQAEEECASIEARYAEAETSIARLFEDQRRAEAGLSEAQGRLMTARETIDALSASAAEARAAHAAMTERASALVAERARLEDMARDIETRVAARASELEQVRAKREALIRAIAEGTRLLDDDVRALTAMREHVHRADQAAADVRIRVDGQDTVIREARQMLEQIRAQAGELDVARATAQSDLTHLAQLCEETIQASLDQILSDVEQMEQVGEAMPDAAVITAEEPDPETEDGEIAAGDPDAVLAEARFAREGASETGVTDADLVSDSTRTGVMTAEEAIGALKAKIERLGPVNMMAIEQFDELEARHTFLATQRKDLVDSIDQTTNAIKRIDETSTARFNEAFSAIQHNFQQTFGTLFGGGRAGLALLDENDPLESGIDIVASPPGKRLQNVQLLSGGEKALTAIALMFAIFKYKPSPFCLLDEIDAPLDDANVGRFVEMLQGMLDKTQFILITHNRRTMEIANRLYGVTMEEPGVSKLISVQLN
jgi:chromosome segregation protein